MKKVKSKPIWALSKGHEFSRPGKGRGGVHQDRKVYDRRTNKKVGDD